MVFESVVTDVLNKILGDYVQNLDKTQLKIGIWGGDVVLNNLQLRENALDDLNLPVQLVFGYLGKLVLKIPWKNLYSQPVVAQIEDFYILISPKQEVQYNAEKEEKLELQTKQAALQAFEEAQLKEIEIDKPKPDASFTEKLTAQIVNNLQMKIANVHIRYEDSYSTGKPFSFGATLSELEIYTTDINWVKSYLTEQVSRVYKIANLDSLSVYMNCNAEIYSTLSQHELSEMFRKNIAREELKPPTYTYVLGPISSIAKLRLNMNPQYDNPPFEIPKIDLTLEMKKLNIGLTSTQFQDIMKLGDAMNRMTLGAPYRKYRPFNIPYKKHYKEWWKFAITAVLEEDIRKRNRYWTWEYMQEHRQLCKTYADKFEEKGLAKQASASLIETCSLLEQKLDTFNLILIRQRVNFKVSKIKEEEAQKAQENSGWFSWFGGGKKNESDTSNDIVKKFEAAMTADEKDKLYKAIGYQENAAPLDLPVFYEAIDMNFKLVALEIGLYDDTKEQSNNSKASIDFENLQTIMLLKFSMATCRVKQRPAASALSITAGMKEMELTGLKQTKESLPPTLIESKVTHELNLLDIFFETNPLDKKCDQRIKVHARPLQIVYDSATVLHLMKVFAPPKSVNLSELEGAASQKVANFKERSATGMHYIIDTHSVIEVDIKFMPNILIIPTHGRYKPGHSSLIVVNLGQLHVTSEHHDTENLLGSVMGQEQILRTLMEKAYDRYTVCIDNIQVLVVKSKESWEDVLQLATFTEMHVLSPTSLTVRAELCVIDDDPRLPKTRVDIELPSIHIEITEDRIFEALHVLSSIPLPESKAPEQPRLSSKNMSFSGSRKSLSMFLQQEAKKVKTKKPTKGDLTIAEVVQYTDLELNFALKEFRVTLNKTSCVVGEKCYVESPADSDKFGTPVAELAVVDSIDEFTQSSSELSIAKPSPVAQKILTFVVLNLEANMAQRTYELVATAKLGAINLTQYDHEDEVEQAFAIINTPPYSKELIYLLTVSYTMANTKSPEFATKYNSTEQMIVVKFSTLDITAHQECLLRLLEISNTMQRKLEAMHIATPPKDREASAADDSILNKLSVILETDSRTETQQNQKRRKSSKLVESIKIHIDANLDQVSLLLTCHKRPLALLKVQHFNAGAIIKSSYTEVNLCLKDIIVTDLNPKTIHTTILSIVGENALQCQAVMYNLDETSDYNSDDLKVDLKIGCVKIVFLNWFVNSVMSFLNNFQAAQEALANASAAAADSAKKNAIDAYDKAMRMKLNVKIKAPIIVVPIDSQSLDAIALDLGYIMLSNVTTEIPFNENNNAVVDEIKIELRDLKLSKCAIMQGITEDDESISFLGSVDTVDLTYGFKSNVNFLNPMSFTLVIKRNLSTEWYHDVPDLDLSGRLKSIELNLFAEDYALIMSILNRNLNEGLNEFPAVQQKKVVKPPTEQAIVEINRKSDKASVDGLRLIDSPARYSVSKKIETVAKLKQKKIYEQLRFNFQFDGVIVNLMLAENEGLARFGLYFLSLKGNKLIDGTLSTSIVLCNIQIDDTRSNTKSKITKYLCRKEWKLKEMAKPNKSSEILEVCETDRIYMLDLTAIIKENDTFAEVRVCGFDLILCIDFLLQLAEFVKIPEEPVDNSQIALGVKVTDPKVAAKPHHQVKSSTDIPKVESKMNLILHVEEPDIILVESLEDINTNAIIFNAQAHLNYRTYGEKVIIHGEIDALKMYMCSFMPERREATKHYIIHPCVISLQGSTPEMEGLHISLKLSEMIINISPSTIEMVNKALLTISANTSEKLAVQKKEVDYTGLWNAKKFKENDYWFIKIDEGEDALACIDHMESDSSLLRPKNEKCVIEVPSIMLVVETGVGYYTTPLLSIDTRLNGVASNWSQKMKVNGSLCLNMNYYNQALAVWEPLIEMNERCSKNGMKEYLPWELNFGLEIETKKCEFDESIEEQTTKIKIQSEEMLEVTMSKTCLDLLGVLGEAFSQAIDAKGLVKPEVIAPYVVENDTGFEITINFRRGIFTLHACHMPSTTTPNKLNCSLLFQSEEIDVDFTPEQVKQCKISAGGRAFLQTKDLSTITCEEDESYNIYVSVGGINKEIVLPVSKSDKRYFPLYRDTNQDPWGILSEVRSEFGTTKVNIHGVLNVHNHFTTTVSIFRQKPQSEEKILVGEVAAGEVFHVPLHAIYAEYKDLFFSLNGYKVSVQGVKWNDSPTDLTYARQIQCDPIDTFEPFYINALREKTEVFHENTNKFKLLSAYYTIHLRPPLYLRNALPIDITVSVAGCSVRHSNEVIAKEEEDMSKSLVKEDLLDYGEKQVNPGDMLLLPTVKVRSKSKEGKSFLVLRLIQYLEKDWSCTTEISADSTNLAIWTFTSYDSAAKMDMDLCVRFESGKGSLIVTLFSPFWMINKTGMMLSYKTDTESVDVLYHPPEYKGPILFSFREKFFFDKKSASIRVDNGDWSNHIPLDVAGSIGSVTCKANDTTYEIGVHNHLTYNSLTKQITFIPFYIASNKCSFPIELQEQSRPGDAWIKIESNACEPLWPKNDSDHMIIARVHQQTTVAFNYSEVQCTLLQLTNTKWGGINVDVQTTEGAVYITFTEYHPGDAPGLLINHTSKPVVYSEKGSKIEKILEPGRKILYTWIDPVGDKRLIFGRNATESDLCRDGVGELILSDGAKAFWVSFLNGLQRVLLFTEVESIATKSESSSTLQSVTQSIEIRIHGIGLSVVNNSTGVDILYLGVTSSGIIWEHKKENKKRFKQMKIHDTQVVEAQYQQYLLDSSIGQKRVYALDNKWPIDFEKMTLTKAVVSQLQRTAYPGVWISLKSSPFQSQIHAKINKIQIDNQLTDCIFPVVLAPIPPPKSVATTTALKPFIEFSMVQRVVPNSTVKQFKYASMLIQEFHFKVDLLFLTAIVELFNSDISDEQAAKLFNENVTYIEKPLSDLVETHSMLEQKNFYDNLHLGPLKIHVSFSMAGSDTTALPGILSTLVQGVGVTLTDVNDVVFRLAFFEREYKFFTQQQLTSEIQAHYTGQALKQLYVLVLGLDVLGNPYGLVVGLKKGVEDLFYEPFQGAIQGPGEFAEGLVLGVKSLFGHTVGGAAGAVSKITGAMGKGLAVLTFDDDYQKKRRQNLNKKPLNFQEGIARSSKGLVMGFVDGVTGVVSKPVTGAREEGVEGFFKGLGKGAIGLVARPTAGVVDFASGSFEAVKRATESHEEAQRLRPPRFLHQDNVLRPYCLDEAQGNKMLKEIEKGKYCGTDSFAYCEEIVQKHEYVLVSNHRVIYTQKNDLFGNWAVQWTYLWHEIASIISSDRGVELTLKKEAKKMLGLFSTHEAQRKVILIPQKSRRDHLAEFMESLRKES